MEYLFLFSVFMVVYVYFLYPITLKIFAMLNFNEDCEFEASNLPTVSIVIPAHNEEDVIEGKILNHLDIDYPSELLNIIILNDSSNDNTETIANEYAEKYPSLIHVFNVDCGLGKTNAINKLMPSVNSDITVFSDANVYLERSAIKAIVSNYSNPEIGGVAGELNYVNSNISSSAYSNGIYWKYEEFIKRNESITGSIMGADGSIFSIRTGLYRSLPVYVLDDFSTSIGVLIQGYRFILEPRAKAFEKGAENLSEEFTRKVRISNRSYNTFLELKNELHSKMKMFDLIKLYSHKVLRWYTFVFLFFALFSNLFLLNVDMIFLMTLFLQFIFYSVSFVGYLYPKGIFKSKLFSIVTYFTFTNVATAFGVFLSLSGKKITRWKKAETTR